MSFNRRRTPFTLAATTALLLLAGAALASEGAEAHGGGHGEIDVVFVLSLLFNFTVFIVIMFLLLRRRVPEFFRSRSQEVEEKLAAADRAREAAEAKAADFASKIDELLKTREEILKKAVSEAEAEKDRILMQARQESKRLLSEVEWAISLETEKSRRRLTEDLVREVATQAEAILRQAVTPQDTLTLMDDAIARLKEVKSA